MNPILILMTFGSFLLALGIRHFTQGITATLLGDGSPARERRLTVNPARHLNVLGFCVALVFSFPIGAGLPAGIGWGAPLRVDGRRMSTSSNTGAVLVALSGLLVNLLLGIGIAIGLGFIPLSAATAQHILNQCGTLQGGPLQGCLSFWQPGWALRLEQFGFIFAGVNITLAVLNLIPLFPLDGHFIALSLLPDRLAFRYRDSEHTQEIILAAILLLVPLVLSIAGLPGTLAPGYLVEQGTLQVLSSFTYFGPFALIL